LELNAGEGGEEGRFKSGQPEEAGVKEWWDSETRFEDGKPTETGLEEREWDEVQPKRARAVPGQQQLEGFAAGRLAHQAGVGAEHCLVACQTEQWGGVRATKDFDCQEQLERQEIEKRFRDKKVTQSVRFPRQVDATNIQQPCQGSPRLQKLNGLATKISHKLSVTKPRAIDLTLAETFETSFQLRNSLHWRLHCPRQARRGGQPS